MAPFTLLLGTISKEKEFSLQKEELPKSFDLAPRLFGEAAENRIDRPVLVIGNLLENPLPSCLKLHFLPNTSLPKSINGLSGDTAEQLPGASLTGNLIPNKTRALDSVIIRQKRPTL